MIFVTVGTHEQPFDRLIQAVDHLKEEGIIQEDVFIQSGYSNYEPKHCQWQNIVTNAIMQEKVKEARIVITHGGPASIMDVIMAGKIPIVVPRQAQHDEHVDNHQVKFCRFIVTKGYDITVVEDINQLAFHLNDSQPLKGIESNTTNFNFELKKLLNQLVQAQ